MYHNVRFYGNLYMCPAGKRNPDCPIFEIQNLSFAERVEWYDELSSERKSLIEEHHKDCVGKR